MITNIVYMVGACWCLLGAMLSLLLILLFLIAGSEDISNQYLAYRARKRAKKGKA